jgi:release factor glutamine methyltransferase
MLACLDLQKNIEQQLREAGILNAKRESKALLSLVLNCSYGDVDLWPEREIPQDVEKLLSSHLKRRIKREPFAYIASKVSFLDCEIDVAPEVLIPRQETEILVDRIIKELEKEDLSGKVLWDMCTGSGCIGISIKQRFPQLEVVLIDVCPKALALAERNAQKNEVKVTCVLSDFFTNLEGSKADYFICNPPYVSEDEYEVLESEVKDYEPRKALVAQEEGFKFYSLLSKQLHTFLNSEGKAWFELGKGQIKKINSWFSSQEWKTVSSSCDFSGIERFFFLERE